MKGRVEILGGLAGSGKTTRLLDLYRAELLRLRESVSPGQAVWITPTNRSRRQILSTLLDGSLRVSFAPNVLTFTTFAERILRAGGLDVVPLSPVARRMIARTVIDEAVSERTVATPLSGRATPAARARGDRRDQPGDKSLRYYAPIARTSGFVDLFLDFVSELKRDETWPEEFEAGCRDRGSPPREIDLALLYRRYQERLSDLALYDAEGRFWMARSALADGMRAPFEQLSLVIADGFADFTQPQYEILEHLAAYAERVIVALPLEKQLGHSERIAKSGTSMLPQAQTANGGRGGLFAKSDATLLPQAQTAPGGPGGLFAKSDATLLPQAQTANGGRGGLFAKSEAARKEIGRRCETTCTMLDLPPATSPASAEAAFRHIAAHLFDNPRNLPQLSHAEGIKILEAAGPSGEARAIAERIKALLLDRVPPEKIVVALRSVDEEGDALAEALAAAGIPCACEFRPPLSQMPVCKAAVAALQAELEDWSFERLAALLRSNYFRPRWTSAADPHAVDCTIDTLRRFGLGSDRAHILKRVSRLAAAKEGDPAQPAVQMASAVLRDLSHAMTRLRQTADFDGWVDRVMSLCAELGIAPADGHKNAPQSDSDDGLDQRDRNHWQILKEVLYEAARTLAQLGDRRQIPFSEFAERLRDILESQTIASAANGVGKVLILDAAELRNLDVDYLFLAGLSEASFPRGRPDDCFYTEAERRKFVRKSDAASSPSTSQQDEMLLFYSIVTRARRRLTLSFPAVSASGEPRFQSPFLASLRDLFAPQALKVDALCDLDPLPSKERMLTAADFRLLATDAVRERKPGLFVALAERPALAACARSVVAAADMAAARFEENGFGPFEGMLRLPPILRRLAEIFPSSRAFHATQLESYATCPFRFLLSQVLNIQPRELAETEIGPRWRGGWLHDVLKQLHRPADKPDRRSEGSSPIPDGPSITKSLRALVELSLTAAEETNAFERALLAAERQFAERFAGLYADQWAAYCAAMEQGWEEPPRPLFVEHVFGPVSDRTGGRPESSASEPAPCAVFGAKEAEVRVCGRIDRVDAGRRNGRTEFAVIDYKTRSGQPFRLDDIRSGLALQLALYAAAIRQTGLLGPDAAVHQLLYWNLTRTGCVPGLKGISKKPGEPVDATLLQEIDDALHRVLPTMVAKMRAGEFPVHNADAECTGSCEFHTVCRVNQIRAIELEREKEWGLTPP